LNLGKQHLPIYYKNRLDYFIGNKLIEAELDIRNVEIEGVPVKGSIDKIDKIELNYVRIVDYKTGKYRAEKIKAPNEKNPLGGDYWRQVIFYKLLLENYHRRDFIVKEGVIDYVEPDAKTNENKFVTIDIHHEHLETVKNQITETYKKIKNHEFYEGCGKPTCEWCNFTLKQELQDNYHDDLEADFDE
jgi:DNA helicase-2/ATP-dependent DNA helicase PcrA